LKMDYLYDGSFDGLLTSIYYSYYEQRAQGIYPEASYQFNMFTPSTVIQSDPVLAARVYDAIDRKISVYSLMQIYYVYLSNNTAKENLILKYLQLGFQLGPKIDSIHSHPEVLPIRQTAKKVSFEAERFLGLLRFTDTRSYLYSALEPDHNILILLADHFADRLAGERFIIHDKKRSLAIICNKKDWYLSDFSEEAAIPDSETEQLYQELWAKYFTRISIENRKNKKLQSHFIPQRYRHNLVEFRKSELL